MAQRRKESDGLAAFCGRRVPQDRSESGQSILALALLLPFLLVLLLGVVELGRAAFISIVVSHGASAGVGYGAQSGTTAVNATGMITAVTNDASYVTAANTTATYGCTCDTGAGTSCSGWTITPSTCTNISSSCSSGQIVECVKVTTTATFQSLFNYPGLPSSFQANGSAVMRVRR